MATGQRSAPMVVWDDTFDLSIPLSEYVSRRTALWDHNATFVPVYAKPERYAPHPTWSDWYKAWMAEQDRLVALIPNGESIRSQRRPRP